MVAMEGKPSGAAVPNASKGPRKRGGKRSPRIFSERRGPSEAEALGVAFMGEVGEILGKQGVKETRGGPGPELIVGSGVKPAFSEFLGPATQEDLDENAQPSKRHFASKADLKDPAHRGSRDDRAIYVHLDDTAASKQAIRAELAKHRNLLAKERGAVTVNDEAALARIASHEQRLVELMDSINDPQLPPNLSKKKARGVLKRLVTDLRSSIEAYNSDPISQRRIALASLTRENGETMAMEKPGGKRVRGSEDPLMAAAIRHAAGHKPVAPEKPGDRRAKAAYTAGPTETSAGRGTGGPGRKKERVEPSLSVEAAARAGAPAADSKGRREPVVAKAPTPMKPVAAAAPAAPAKPATPAPAPKAPATPAEAAAENAPTPDEALMDEVLSHAFFDGKKGRSIPPKPRTSARAAGPTPPPPPATPAAAVPTPPTPPVPAAPGGTPPPPVVPPPPPPPPPGSTPATPAAPQPIPGSPISPADILKIHERTGKPQELAAMRDRAAQANLDAAKYEGFGLRRIGRFFGIGSAKYEAAKTQRTAAEKAWSEKINEHAKASFEEVSAAYRAKRPRSETGMFEFQSRYRGRLFRELAVSELRKFEARKAEMFAASQGPAGKKLKAVTGALLKKYSEQNMFVRAVPAALIASGAMVAVGGVGVIGGGAAFFGWRYGRALLGTYVGVKAGDFVESATNRIRGVKGRKEARDQKATSTRRGLAAVPGTSMDAAAAMRTWRAQLAENNADARKDQRIAFVARMAGAAAGGGLMGALLSPAEAAAQVPPQSVTPGAVTPPQAPAQVPPQAPSVLGNGRGIAPRVEPYFESPDGAMADADPETLRKELAREAALRAANRLYNQPTAPVAPASPAPSTSFPSPITQDDATGVDEAVRRNLSTQPAAPTAPQAPVVPQNVPSGAPQVPPAAAPTIAAGGSAPFTGSEPALGTIEQIPVARAPYTPFGKVTLDKTPGSWIWNITERGFSGDAQLGAAGDSRFLSLDRAQKDFFLDAYAKNLDAHLKTLSPAELKTLGFRNPDVNLAAWPNDTLDLSYLNNQELYEKTMKQVDELSRAQRENILRYRGWTPAQIKTELDTPRLSYLPPTEARLTSAGEPYVPPQPQAAPVPPTGAPAQPTAPGAVVPPSTVDFPPPNDDATGVNLAEALNDLRPRDPIVVDQDNVSGVDNAIAAQDIANSINNSPDGTLGRQIPVPPNDDATGVDRAVIEEAVRRGPQSPSNLDMPDQYLPTQPPSSPAAPTPQTPTSPTTIDVTAAEEAARAGALEGERALERANVAASYADEIQRGMERSARIAEMEGEIRRTADTYYAEDLRSIFDVPQTWFGNGEDGLIRFERLLGWRGAEAFLNETPADVADAIGMEASELAKLQTLIRGAIENYGIKIEGKKLVDVMRDISRAQATAALIEP